MAPETEKDSAAATLLLELFKEQTQAQLENTKALRALVLQIVGLPPDEHHPDGLIGLMDRLGDLGEAVDELDNHIVGQNVMLARINFVFDRMVEIASGEESAPELPLDQKEPEAGKTYKTGRVPVFRDLSAILLDYEKEMEEEARRESEAEEKEMEAEISATAPAKSQMMSNGPAAKPHPRLKALPPMPVSAPLPPMP